MIMSTMVNEIIFLSLKLSANVVRCMISSLVRIGFVRGSMAQGNGCYQHRCTSNSLQV